jgi:hypothetical protein
MTTPNTVAALNELRAAVLKFMDDADACPLCGEPRSESSAGGFSIMRSRGFWICRGECKSAGNGMGSLLDFALPRPEVRDASRAWRAP